MFGTMPRNNKHNKHSRTDRGGRYHDYSSAERSSYDDFHYEERPKRESVDAHVFQRYKERGESSSMPQDKQGAHASTEPLASRPDAAKGTPAIAVARSESSVPMRHFWYPTPAELAAQMSRIRAHRRENDNEDRQQVEALEQAYDIPANKASTVQPVSENEEVLYPSSSYYGSEHQELEHANQQTVQAQEEALKMYNAEVRMEYERVHQRPMPVQEEALRMYNVKVQRDAVYYKLPVGTHTVRIPAMDVVVKVPDIGYCPTHEKAMYEMQQRKKHGEARSGHDQPVFQRPFVREDVPPVNYQQVRGAYADRPPWDRRRHALPHPEDQRIPDRHARNPRTMAGPPHTLGRPRQILVPHNSPFNWWPTPAVARDAPRRPIERGGWWEENAARDLAYEMGGLGFDAEKPRRGKWL